MEVEKAHESFLFLFCQCQPSVETRAMQEAKFAKDPEAELGHSSEIVQNRKMLHSVRDLQASHLVFHLGTSHTQLDLHKLQQTS